MYNLSKILEAKSEVTLLNKMREECENARTRIGGLILYTRKDPYMVKVLGDDDFWNALNELSGSNWPIFSVKPLKEGKYGFPYSDGYSLNMMVLTWQEPNENKKILDFFGIESSEELPCFVTFIWDDNEKLLRTVSKIDGTSVDTTYESLFKIIEIITETEKQIKDENKLSESVYREVSQNLKAYNCRKTLKEWRGKIKDFLDLFF